MMVCRKWKWEEVSDKQSLWSSASWREGWAEGYGDHTGDSSKKQGWMLVLRLLITEGEARKQPWREPMQCFQSNGQSPGRRATCLGRRWCCLERGMSWKRRCKGLFKTVRDSLGCGEETSHTWGKKWSARLWTAAWRKENFRIGRRWWGTRRAFTQTQKLRAEMIKSGGKMPTLTHQIHLYSENITYSSSRLLGAQNKHLKLTKMVHSAP